MFRKTSIYYLLVILTRCILNLIVPSFLLHFFSSYFHSLIVVMLQMFDDQDLGFFANFLGIFIFILVIAYHFVVADPKFEWQNSFIIMDVSESNMSLAFHRLANNVLFLTMWFLWIDKERLVFFLFLVLSSCKLTCLKAIIPASIHMRMSCLWLRSFYRSFNKLLRISIVWVSLDVDACE